MSHLGIDLGTSGLRALLIESDGTVCGAAAQSYDVATPHAGWSEQDPADWITALERAIDELRQNCPQFAALRSIGVAGHMHGATLLDAADQVIRPCILWNDTRAHQEAAALDAMPHARAISGNIVFPGFTAPKLAWVKTHEPQAFAKVAKVLLPAAYLNFYLSGAYASDMSDSAGTSWLDTGARAWSDQLLTAGGMRADQMPRLVEGCAPAGQLRKALAARWGVKGAVVIAGGAGDNAAAACGIGALREGDGFLSLGTSGVILAARDGYHPDAATAVHTFCHAVPERWYQMGVMLAATDALNWLGTITGAAPADLTAALGEALKAPAREMFAPYLSGERTPHNDAAIRGSFTGLGTDTGRDELTRAVLAGVAYGLRDSYEALAATGASVQQLTAIGGGARSAHWLKMIATVLGLPLDVPQSGEFGAALGAARLGQIAQSGADPSDILRAPKIARRIMPEPDLKDAYDAQYRAFRAAYPVLKPISCVPS